jgi:hypothetical protein
VGTNSKRLWSDFVREPDAADHAVQVYAEDDELARTVAAYLTAGFARGEPGVVIATPEHRLLVEAALPDAPGDLLTWLDADETLDAFLVEGRPDRDRFEAVVGGVLDDLAARFPGRHVRAFGEMVDLLARRGERVAAAELEELWNGALALRNVSLLCGYHADPFAVDEQVGLFPVVCAAHTRMLLTADPERFQHAVDAALYAALGPDGASRVYRSIADAVVREPAVPVAQHALMWVSAHMPARAEIVVADARRRYRFALSGLQPATAV